MFINEKEKKINLSGDIISNYDLPKVAFFDIETTGFERGKDFIILISLGRLINNSTISIKQYFADNLQEEREVILNFCRDLKNFNNWCSFNGIAFDEPFIKEKIEKYSLGFELPEKHIDLYRMIKPYKKDLGLEHCGLKHVEKYAGIERTDKIDGGISAQLYYEYLDCSEENIRNTMLLHNFEDVLNLPVLFKLIYKIDNSIDFKREDAITEKQVSFLKSLLLKNKIEMEIDLNKFSKRAASKVIDYLLNGNNDKKDILSIMNIINKFN